MGVRHNVSCDRAKCSQVSLCVFITIENQSEKKFRLVEIVDASLRCAVVERVSVAIVWPWCGRGISLLYERFAYELVSVHMLHCKLWYHAQHESFCTRQGDEEESHLMRMLG